MTRLEVGSLTVPTTEEDSPLFDRTLLECIDDGVKAILGEEVRESLFIRLETYQIRRDEIPRHVDAFFAALEKAFGQASGQSLGKFIIKLLYARLGLEFDGRSDELLVDYALNARKWLVQEY
jgi:hypothetical protein